jgi:hypothetical protein
MFDDEQPDLRRSMEMALSAPWSAEMAGTAAGAAWAYEANDREIVCLLGLYLPPESDRAMQAREFLEGFLQGAIDVWDRRRPPIESAEETEALAAVPCGPLN